MKTNKVLELILLTLILSSTPALVQAATTAKPPDRSAGQPVKAASMKQDTGQRKFEANCGRCHTAPEQLSPSLTGTVARHMRVRASLNAEDEKDILKFLAP
jgi:cytochrome c5